MSFQATRSAPSGVPARTGPLTDSPASLNTTSAPLFPAGSIRRATRRPVLSTHTTHELPAESPATPATAPTVVPMSETSTVGCSVPATENRRRKSLEFELSRQMVVAVPPGPSAMPNGNSLVAVPTSWPSALKTPPGVRARTAARPGVGELPLPSR